VRKYDVFEVEGKQYPAQPIAKLERQLLKAKIFFTVQVDGVDLLIKHASGQYRFYPMSEGTVMQFKRNRVKYEKAHN
jgi:hypothetical protein